MKNHPLYSVPKFSSIQEMIQNRAGVYSNKLALQDLADTLLKQVTYSQLYENIIKFGKALSGLGIVERDHIAVIGDNRVQWAITYLTAMCYNLVIVPIDKNLSVNEIINILHESDSKAIVYSEKFESTFIEKRDSLKKLKLYISMDRSNSVDGYYSMIELINKENTTVEKLPVINPDEMAEIIFTSGSLGRAKGVMLSQKNLTANISDMTSFVNIKESDRFLSVLPIHHTYECTCGFLCPLSCGSSVHFTRSLKTIMEDIQTVKATIMLGVPLLYEKMFKTIYKNIQKDKVKSKIIPPLIKLTDFASSLGWKGGKKKIFKELHNKFGGNIRMFIAGGAAPDPKISKGLADFGFTFLQGYGLTETSPILACNRIENFKDEAAGLPLPNVTLKINEPDDDGIGEVFAKGENIMLGYYKNQQLTDENFEDGWFKTGDLGYFDKDGFLHISGRKKNVIITKNGKNVFPEEIEDILKRSPFVQECMIYGKKDGKGDEVITASIVTEAEAFIEYSELHQKEITPELINELIKTAVDETNKDLTGYKRIMGFEIRETEFEKTTTQKIKRYLAQ